MAKQEKAASAEFNENADRARFDFNSLNNLAVVSLATAVTGFGAVAGIITGHIALTQLKNNKQSGRSLAIAGLVIGYAFLALALFGGIARVIWGPRYGLEGIGPMVGGHDDMWRGDDLGGMRGQGDIRFGGDGDGMGGLRGQGGWMMTPPNPTDAPTPETGSTVN